MHFLRSLHSFTWKQVSCIGHGFINKKTFRLLFIARTISVSSCPILDNFRRSGLFVDLELLFTSVIFSLWWASVYPSQLFRNLGHRRVKKEKNVTACAVLYFFFICAKPSTDWPIYTTYFFDNQARRQDIAAGGAQKPGGAKNQKGGTHKNTVLDVCSNQGVKREMGRHRF